MKLRKILKRAVIVFIIALGLYFPLLLGVEAISDAYSDNIKGKSNLEGVLFEEKNKLNMCQDYEINIKIIDEDEASYALKISNEKYEIGLHQTSNRSTIMHELYHIEEGHTEMRKPSNLKESFENKFEYLFLDEPQAAIYALTELKI